MSELTVNEILNDWVYVSNTEANGKHYHDEKTDRSAVVYKNYTKVFSVRKEGMYGNFPACYDYVMRIEPTD